MDGLFVAAAVVTAVQFARLRDRRLGALALMLALLAGAEARERHDPWHTRFQAGALAAGGALMALLSARGAERARDGARRA